MSAWSSQLAENFGFPDIQFGIFTFVILPLQNGFVSQKIEDTEHNKYVRRAMLIHRIKS